MPAVHIRRALALAAAAVTALVLTGVAAPVAADGLGGGPAPPNPDPNEVGVSGTDSALWVLQDFPGIPFMSLGGSIVAAPAVVSVPSVVTGVPIYIATGQDNRLWVRSRLQGWQLLSSSAFCIDNPAAVVVKSKPTPVSLILTVACHGADHALWFAQEPVVPGVLPSPSLGFQSLGGALVNGPAVAAVNPLGTTTVNDELTFFVNGTDGRVWTRTPDSPWTQQSWACLGHPATAAFISGTFQVTQFVCQGTDRQLWLALNNGAAWSPAFALGGIVVDGPGLAVGSRAYAEGADGALWRRNGSWTSLGGQAVHGAGAANLLPLVNNP